jgi:CheY-like chemotaxis protein
MSASSPSRSSQKPLILVADDDKTIQSLLRVTLERSGYLVESAVNGVDAVRLALERRPSLILMDVKMPLMDGFEAVVKLRENLATARIPVIFLTAAAMEPSDTVRGFDLGADDYLHKPFGVEETHAGTGDSGPHRRAAQRGADRTGSGGSADAACHALFARHHGRNVDQERT